jgi:hypothetical protein
MHLFGNKFYIIFISIWIIGLYILLTTFHLSSDNEQTSEDRIKDLKNEIETLQQKILQIQSNNNNQPPSSSYQCQELNDELKRVKRQLKEKSVRKTIVQCMYIKSIVYFD